MAEPIDREAAALEAYRLATRTPEEKRASDVYMGAAPAGVPKEQAKQIAHSAALIKAGWGFPSGEDEIDVMIGSLENGDSASVDALIEQVGNEASALALSAADEIALDPAVNKDVRLEAATYVPPPMVQVKQMGDALKATFSATDYPLALRQEMYQSLEALSAIAGKSGEDSTNFIWSLLSPAEMASTLVDSLQGDRSTVEMGRVMLANVVPFQEATGLKAVLEAILPELSDSDSRKLMLGGAGASRLFVERHMTFLFREGGVDAVRQWLTNAAEVLGKADNEAFGINVLHKGIVAEQILRLAGGDFTASLGDVVSSIVGPLDIMAAGSLAKATAKAGMRMLPAPNTPAAALITSGDELAQEALRAALLDAKTADSLGTTPAEVALATALPAVDGGVSMAARGIVPPNAARSLAITDSLADDVIQSSRVNLAFTTEEAEAAAKAWENRWGMSNELVEYLPTHTRWEGIGDGTGVIKSESVFKKAGSKEWTSKEAALRDAALRFGEDETFVLLGKYKGEWKPVDPALGRTRSYRVQYNKVFHEDSEFMKNSKITLGDDYGVAVHLGIFPQWLMDNSSMFKKFVTKLNTSGHITELGIRATARKMMPNLVRLSGEESNKMLSVMRQMEGQPVPTFQDLVGLHNLTPKAAASYFELRKLFDTAHAVENGRLYRQLFAGNYRSIENADIGFKAFGKPLGRESAMKQASVEEFMVYDPVTKELKQLFSEDINRLYDDGGSVAILRTPHTIDEAGVLGTTIEDATRIIIRPSDGTLNKPLPHNVLPYHQGYMPHAYDQTHFVQIKRTGKRDGKPIRESDNDYITVGAATSHKHAAALVEELIEQGGDIGKIKIVKAGKYLQKKQFGAGASEELTLTGELFTGYRGKELLESIGPTGQRNIAALANPISTAELVIGRMSHHAAMETPIWSLEQRILNTFGNALDGFKGKDGLPRIPHNIADIRSAEAGKGAMVKAAKAQVRLYWGMKRMEPQARHIHNAILRVADWFEEGFKESSKGALRDGVPKILREAAQINPVEKLRQVTFLHLIAGGLMRQWVIQPSMLLFYADKLARPAIMRDMMAVTTLALAKTAGNDTFASVLAQMAKSMGASPADLEHMYNALHKSGFASGIDAHDITEIALGQLRRHFAGQSGLGKVEATGRAVVQAAKGVGFDAGEYANRLGHIFVARDMWRKMPENAGKVWTAPKNIKEIAALAEELTFSQSGGSKFAYQKGRTIIEDILSIKMQFFQIQHKMGLVLLSALTKGKAGNQAIPREAVMRLSILTGLLYGAEGYGLKEAYDWAMEEAGASQLEEKDFKYVKQWYEDYVWNAAAQNVHTFIEGGTVNLGLKLATGEDIDLAANIAPMAGISVFADKIAEHATSINPFEMEFWGAAGAVGKKWENVINVGKMMYFDPKRTTTEKLTDFAKYVPNGLAGGISNITKARLASQYGMLVDGSGMAIDEAGTAAVYAQLFGITTDEAKDMYRINKLVTEMYTKGTGDSVEEALRADVRAMYSSAQKALFATLTDPTLNKSLSMETARGIMKHHFGFFTVLDAAEIEIVQDEIQKQESRYNRMLATLPLEGHPDDPAPTLSRTGTLRSMLSYMVMEKPQPGITPALAAFLNSQSVTELVGNPDKQAELEAVMQLIRDYMERRDTANQDLQDILTEKD